ncbi:MBL fold metallo-hydrolase [Bariatricus massiliensis]|uniref:MBL fold metallo-hydrolase n=1 Tax=Bariatricus massiliensis TaxID=1745713 RepID=A0ABS8DGS6_9FIRM|nr:FprA family A-type flavoprotein [Bariatricus massiliensis]MCB7304507.1 MBL fold metallo-hydrolase [Bariatricus massiliensis]MCB7375159.1 MBL fold metallo-hydrolase [Bariatricus massiliensis]MCB7387618.1 MBL fold metallo-hydrolase [Bariatricus massiliensis]MCB7411779.1 MBL fold metallo-hydrolase [Bariatricus massiliensis]MCQ5253915.1 MBL fold metallo-hydrolase [Bariatricus massiliensis]
MSKLTISDAVKYIGADDKTLDLFESQYSIPNGVSYNSYVILDEKIAVMDTVDSRKTEEWKENLQEALAGRAPDYLVISHLEPDHAANIQHFVEMYPQAMLVASAKAVSMLPQFFDISNLKDRTLVVKEGETLSLGSHTLQFFMAPMVHWPEVMVEYEQSEKILFSADGFGKFGALDVEEDWTCEARRYYFNIVGKYGAQVQGLLKKLSSLEVRTICPLHGPVLTENIEYYIGKYLTWSSYEPEDDGVLVAYASIHGNTKHAAEKMKDILEAKGAEKVVLTDLSRDDMAEAVEDAFRYDKVILAAASYDGGVFPCMESFLLNLSHKNYQKRKIGLMENGSWAPCAGRVMKGVIEGMKNIGLCENMVTIKSVMNEENIKEMEMLAEEILG